MPPPPGTIVVGIDASEHSMNALAWAVEQARLERRPLTLVHAVTVPSPTYVDAAVAFPSSTRDLLRADGRRVLDEAREKVEWLEPELEVHEVLHLADPRETLFHLSRQAALVVVGSRGRGRLHSLLGSVSVYLARHAHCPVVVHRPDAMPGSHARREGIVVAVDTREESRAVLEFAYREAALRQSPLTVLHCFWDVLAGSASGYAVAGATIDLEPRRLGLAELMAGLQEKYPEVQVHTELERGVPQHVVVTRGRNAQLIVVGAHRASRLSQVVYGSVSVAVVEHACGPVAVVPVLALD